MTYAGIFTLPRIRSRFLYFDLSVWDNSMFVISIPL